MSMSVWAIACQLLAQYLATEKRLDHLLEALPDQSSGADLRRARHLIYGVIRHLALLDHATHGFLHTQPRPLLRAALLTGAFELMENPASAPAIVHHAVEQTRRLTSVREAGLVNAVLRRTAERLPEILAAEPDDAPGLAIRYSHPPWLVARWQNNWGIDRTRALLRWNLQPAEVFARVTRKGLDVALPATLEATPWPGFYRAGQTEWNEIETLLVAGSIYIQNPATRIAINLLDPRPGETVLDLCAAPGGKTLQLAEAVGSSGQVVAVDLPGPRLVRLKENLARSRINNAKLIPADASGDIEPALHKLGAPTRFDAVLADVPCSNTGVLRHRVDAKWRLQPERIAELADLQLRILNAASTHVKPGGRLVYSTCSLEPEENESLVSSFLASHGDEFQLEASQRSFPPDTDCDGAETFLLRRP